MSNEKMREEFEIAVRLEYPKANLNRCDMTRSLRLGQYVDECIQHAWWGWQASRAAVVIELPLLENFKGDESAHGMLVMCRHLAQSAGLKVKP